MTHTDCAPAQGASSAVSKIDVAAIEILCSLYLARTYGEDQPGVWCEDARGIAAAKAVGVKPHDTRFDRETAFVAGFDLGVRITAIVANDPCGPIGLSIDREIASTQKWLGIDEEPVAKATDPRTVSSHAGYAPDARATKRAVADARKLLASDLPKVATELQRQAAVILNAHADLDGDLTALEDVFVELVDPRGVLSDGPRDTVAVAVDLVRGEAYIAKNGDTCFHKNGDS